MRKALLGYGLIFLLVFNLSGCAPLFIGAAAGGVAMYAAGKDTIEGNTDTAYELLWDAALKVARIRGTVTREDVNSGIIQVDAKPNMIWINFVRLTAATTKIKVSARKYRLPNIDLAQDIFVKIIEEAKPMQ